MTAEQAERVIDDLPAAVKSDPEYHNKKEIQE